MRVRRLASQALVDIFSSLGGNRWENRGGWLAPGTDVKRWHGITLSAGKLVSLNLISSDLEVRHRLDGARRFLQGFDDVLVVRVHLLVLCITKTLGFLQSRPECIARSEAVATHNVAAAPAVLSSPG